MRHIIFKYSIIFIGATFFALNIFATNKGQVKSFTGIYNLLDTTVAEIIKDSSGLVDTTTLVAIKDTIEAEKGVKKANIGNIRTLAGTDEKPKDTLNPHSREKIKGSFDDILYGKAKDSIVYSVKNKKINAYKDGNVKYQKFDSDGDFLQMDMNTNIIIAYGSKDTSGTYKKINFIEGKNNYKMDTVRYNMKSKQGKIKNIVTKEGDGIIYGRDSKKMHDDIMNVSGLKYTTCDADCPHFFIAARRAKVIPKKKVIAQLLNVYVEDVPLPLFIPEFFFPLREDKNSGFIMPSFGEENIKGFYLRDGGYYFVPNDYLDFRLTGGIYTLGSWETNLNSSYNARYKYRGGLGVNYSKVIVGDKEAPDYVNQSTFRLQWSHTQDPKFNPNSTFSASVNYSTTGYNKYSAQSMDDYLSSQTNSSIAYSRNWAGRPFSMSTNLQHSQNTRDTTIALTLPSLIFNVSRISPFERKNREGKQKWYEKIYFTYGMTSTNTVRIKQYEMFTPKMYKSFVNGVNHSIPVSTSFNILKYFTFSPSVNYTERWYFKRVNKVWSDSLNQQVVQDTSKGFYRVYNYSTSAALSTRIFGSFQAKSSKALVKAVRHVMSPSISINYMPDFGDPSYGYYRPIQVNSRGDMGYYSPYEGLPYGVPGKGKSASLGFSLGNTLEMKVRNDKDTSGVKKVSIFESLNFSSGYNFLAKQFKLSNIGINGRTTIIKGLGISFGATLDPYMLDENGQRVDKYALKNGKGLGRLTAANFSFGYNFNGGKSSSKPSSGQNKGHAGPGPMDATEQAYYNSLTPEMQRMYIANQYYDFSVPWTFNINYSFNYSKPALTKNVNQTVSFSGNFDLTSYWKISYSGGYDFKMNKITPGTIGLMRDLHCMSMTFNWVPIGYRQSWNFTIRVTSPVLRDLKYDKSSSFWDNMYDN